MGELDPSPAQVQALYHQETAADATGGAWSGNKCKQHQGSHGIVQCKQTADAAKRGYHQCGWGSGTGIQAKAASHRAHGSQNSAICCSSVITESIVSSRMLCIFPVV